MISLNCQINYAVLSFGIRDERAKRTCCAKHQWHTEIPSVVQALSPACLAKRHLGSVSLTFVIRLSVPMP